MLKKLLRHLVASAVVLCSIPVSPAVAGDTGLRAWFGPAMGGAGVESWGGGLMGAGTVSFQRGPVVASVRATSISDGFIDENHTAGDYGLLFGVGTQNDGYHLSFSAGGGVATEGVDTWSIPLQVQVYRISGDTFALGSCCAAQSRAEMISSEPG